MVSSDTAVPYERPPLSKGFLAGKEDEAGIWINPPEFYSARGIELTLAAEVTGIDVARRTLRLRSGEDRGFEKLVIATGARVRTLDVPGGLSPGVYYLRSLDDSKRIRTHARGAKRAVVIGSGFIGMEAASVLAQQGIEVTMVLREERIWPKLFTPAMSKMFEGYFGARGVRFIRQAEVKEIGKQSSLAVAIRTAGGSETVDADLVVAGIGVRPAIEMLADSGIGLGDGVMVNEYLETNQPGIYAAGDVANYVDLLYGVRRRAEHWDNAVSQGQHCARELAGERKPFIHVPYFFSDVFDLSYEFWGDASGAGEVVGRGDPQAAVSACGG